MSNPNPDILIKSINDILKSKAKELNAIKSEFPKQIESLLSSYKDLQSKTKEITQLKITNEDLQKLQISKDSEIKKLNEQLSSKDSEIKKLKKEISDSQPKDVQQREKELKAEFDKEKKNLKSKINDLELKIYKLNDEKNKLESINESQKKKNSQIEEEKEKLKGKNETDNKEENNNEEQGEEEEKEEEPNDEEQKDEEEQNEENKELNESQSISPCVPKETYDRLNEDFSNLNKQYLELKNLIENQLTNKEEQMNQSHQLELDDLKVKYENEVKKKEKVYLKLNEANSKVINEYLIKMKEYEEKINKLTSELDIAKRSKNELEDIVLKQETKVNNLGKKVNKIEKMLQKKNNEIQQSEAYAVQLMNIIKEQKTQIQKIENKKRDDDDEEINSYLKKIEELENIIEIRNGTIDIIQKRYTSLQEKYLKLANDKRKKPHQDLLNQAREMKQQKLERKKLNNKNQTKKSNEERKAMNVPPKILDKSKRNNSEDQSLNKEIDESLNIKSVLDNNLKEGNSNNSNVILPLISNEKSNLNINISNDNDNLDEINSMMKQIIEKY